MPPAKKSKRIVRSLKEVCQSSERERRASSSVPNDIEVCKVEFVPVPEYTDYSQLGPSTTTCLDNATSSAIQSLISDACQKAVEKVEQRNKLTLLRLTKEIQLLRKDVIDLKKGLNLSNETILPITPFTSVDDFLQFEKVIQDPEKFNLLKADLRKMSTSSTRKFIAKAWQKILDDSVAECFSWRGTADKTCIRAFTVTTAIRQTFVCENGGIEEDFLFGSKSFFQYARNRLNVKERKQSATQQNVLVTSLELESYTQLFNLDSEENALSSSGIDGKLEEKWKIDRKTALRSEVSSLKARVCGELLQKNNFLPAKPFSTLEDFIQFEQGLAEEGAFNNMIPDLLKTSEVSWDKFVRSCWRQLLTDDAAKQCSWRGTDAKKCVRGLRTTLAIRTAFKQRFAVDDSEFDKVTQRHFQYAADRLSKSQKLNDTKKKI